MFITEKQKLILNYLNDQKGTAYMIDIRDSVAMHFDDEDDFCKILKELVAMNLVNENSSGDTLYQLNTSL